MLFRCESFWTSAIPGTGTSTHWWPGCWLTSWETGVHPFALFHHHPNCQPAPVCQFSHRRAKGTSEKVRVPSLNPNEQNPEDEGFPRTELAKYCFSLGPALRKVNKALLWKPKISSKRIPGRQRVVMKNTETRTVSRAQRQKFIDFGLCRYVSWKKKKKVLRKQTLVVDVRTPTLAV